MVEAFEKIRVLELCHVLAAPYAAYLLGLQGADVIKIEPPHDPDCVRGRGAAETLNTQLLGANFLTQNGNKRSLSLDLGTEQGRQILLRLTENADVVIENYRTGALDALGLGEAVLRERNPSLIYCSLTGYGMSGPRSEVNAYDNVIQAASGLMASTSMPDGTPVKTGASIVDYASGLAAAFAIASALHRRQRDGTGITIDCAMLDTALALLGTDVTNTLLETETPKPRQKESGLGCYQTADGLLMLGAFNRRQHERLWRALGREDFVTHSSWHEMSEYAPVMAAELARRLLERDAATWESWFHEHGIPAERVRSISEAISIVEAQERPFLQQMNIAGETITVPTAPFGFSQDGPRLASPAPALGEHTEAVLSEAGYSGDEIRAFYQAGVVV